MSLCSLILSLETPNDVCPVAQQSKNIQVTRKGSDQTAHMHRLICGFVGCTYHIVGSLILQLMYVLKGVQWISVRVLDMRLRGRGLEPHRRHCVVSLSKNINSSLVLVQPRKTCPFIIKRLLMGHKESNQTKMYVLVFEIRKILSHVFLRTVTV